MANSVLRWERAEVQALADAAKRLASELTAVVTEYESTGRLDTYGGDLQAAVGRLQASPACSSMDVRQRHLTVGGPHGRAALLVYLHATVDMLRLQAVLETLMSEAPSPQTRGDELSQSLLAVAHVGEERRWPKIFAAILSGQPVLLVQGHAQAYTLDLTLWPQRAVPQAQIESSIKGPQDAFTEPLETNIALLRRYMRSSDLRITQMTLGARSNTAVAICYLEGVANPALVAAVNARLNAIQTASIISSAALQAHLGDQRLSLFPLTRGSERIDNAAKSLSEGKIIILADNDPFALAVPATVMDFYQTAQDYRFTFWEGSYTRLIRFAGLLLGLYLPSMYIAMSSVNPDMLPVRFLLVVAGSREGLPFPPVLEVLVMFTIIEVLREATLRLPSQLGQAIGTVGAIVLGTAIVKAGIVSSQMIIVVTLTALAVFTVPDFSMSAPVRIMLWVFVLGSFVLGIFGILIGTWFLLGYVARLSSFGQPYFAPFGPIMPRDLADSVVRAPRMALRRRPAKVHTTDVVQQAPYDLSAPSPQVDQTQESMEAKK